MKTLKIKNEEPKVKTDFSFYVLIGMIAIGAIAALGYLLYSFLFS